MNAALRRIQSFVPWIVIDGITVAASLYLALLFRMLALPTAQWGALFAPAIPLFILLFLLVNALYGLDRRVWRYASVDDITIILFSSMTWGGLGSVFDLLLGLGGVQPLPISVIFLSTFFSFCLFVLTRYRTRLARGLRRTIGRRRAAALGRADGCWHGVYSTKRRAVSMSLSGSLATIRRSSARRSIGLP
ncbi:MAG: hypothetical protein M1118_12045 [Chloroflexi bacterium]|nr:hypothetical protein [Chloroflexota bacterium]